MREIVNCKFRQQIRKKNDAITAFVALSFENGVLIFIKEKILKQDDRFWKRSSEIIKKVGRFNTYALFP